MRSLPTLTAALLLLGGCGDDPLSPDEPSHEIPNGSMSARIDGEAWTADAVLSVSYTGGILAFAGSNTESVTIGVGFIPDGVGAYEIGPGEPTNANVATGTANTWTASSASGSGSVTLTSWSEHSATGTFSFVASAVGSSGATGTRSVTEGVFDVTF